MNKLLADALLGLVGVALENLEKDVELQDQVISKFRGVADFLQEVTGNVNVQDIDAAIQLSLDTVAKRDKQTMCQVISAITTLYATTEVKRGAVCGGTLLQFFGEDIFPHIDPRELRFAKHINEKVYQTVLASIEANFDEKVANYLIKDYIDYSSVQPNASSTVGLEGVLRPLMNNGAKIFKFARKFSKPTKK